MKHSLEAEPILDELAELRLDPRRAVREEEIVCLVCGRAFRQLTNTHLLSHGLTSADYKREPGYNPGRATTTGRRLLPSVRCALMKPKLRVWVMFGEDLKFGDGRARLLALIDERGSLKKAAQELEMSYRNAWGYLRDLEEAAGFKFVERVPGGGPESGMRLTKAGKRFLERYQKFRSGLDEAARKQFDRAFGA